MAFASASAEHAAHQKGALPWVEKYRPESLTDLVSQGDIVTTCTCTSSLAFARLEVFLDTITFFNTHHIDVLCPQ